VCSKIASIGHLNYPPNIFSPTWCVLVVAAVQLHLRSVQVRTGTLRLDRWHSNWQKVSAQLTSLVCPSGNAIVSVSCQASPTVYHRGSLSLPTKTHSHKSLFQQLRHYRTESRWSLSPKQFRPSREINFPTLVVTLVQPSVSSSLQINNRCFSASPHLWNQLPSSFRQPHSVYSPLGSPHPACITTSQSSPSLSPSIPPSTFYSKSHLFHKSFPL